MKRRIEFDDHLMMVLDEENNGHDAFVVESDQAWDAVEALAEWGRQYEFDPVEALGELRRYMKACR